MKVQDNAVPPQTAEAAITHRLTPSFFAEFQAGPIAEKSMDMLRASVYSQRRAMLLAIMAVSAGSGFHARLESCWETLSAIEKVRPEIVEGVLMHPPTGVWLVRALRLLTDFPAEHEPSHHELHYLNSLAAAAAVRAGFPCTITVPVTFGIVYLPTVGSARLPVGTTAKSAELHNSPGSSQIYVENNPQPISLSHFSASPEFFPIRLHRTTAKDIELVVEVDDSGPYRDFSVPAPPHRMSPAEWTHWHKLLDDAWDVLTLRHAGYARELSAGLAVIAPILSSGNVVGSSSSAAFGSIALSTKMSATALAEVLVHELQHSKLNALLELVKLRHDDVEEYWYAPWRDDPRPLTGLLHGVYAFVSVVEFWKHERPHITEADRKREADFVFVYRRHQVRQAVNALRSAPELTELGKQLVDAAAVRVAGCEEETVPLELTEVVALIAKDHWVTWRLQHVSPDEEHVSLLATAWLNGKPAPIPSSNARDHVEPYYRPVGSAARIALLKTKAVDPAGFNDLVRGGDDLGSETHEADIAFAIGDYVNAANAYAGRIRTAPADAHAWAGLAVSLPPRTSAANALVRTPEIAMAMHNRLLGLGFPLPDPVELATWLGA